MTTTPSTMQAESKTDSLVLPWYEKLYTTILNNKSSGGEDQLSFSFNSGEGQLSLGAFKSRPTRNTTVTAMTSIT